MSQKKYLSLEEAAQQVGVSVDELKRLREKGDLRGFADRGTWKFKFEDIEELSRRRQGNSDPDLPLFSDETMNDSAIRGDDDVGEQPTIIRGHDKGSDSDVKLVPDNSATMSFDPKLLESDSDIKIQSNWGGSDVRQAPNIASDVRESPFYKDDSASDVKLTGSEAGKGAGRSSAPSDVRTGSFKLDSDSDVKLVDDGTQPDIPTSKGSDARHAASDVRESPFTLDSDSDVKLVDETQKDLGLKGLKGSDSEIRLAPPDDQDSDVRFNPPSDSDVALLRPGDSSIALDFTPDDGEGASVLSDESSIGLAGDSAMMLASESGISLEGPSDSGISLESGAEEGITLADDSGISLMGADSGISLETASDSGISIDKNYGSTMPMMNVSKFKDDSAETSFEIPSLSDDSAYEMKAVDVDKTAELRMPADSADDAVFNIDDDEASEATGEDDLEVVDDAFGEDDDLGEDLDVIDADEEVFAADGDEGEFAAPVASGRYAPPEQEWGAGVLVGVSLCSVIMLMVGAVMFDLVKTMWTPGQANAVAGPILDALSGLYK